MILDLTSFTALGTTISSFLSLDFQFAEDIATNLASISDVESEFMSTYAEGSSADRELIDKMLDTTENWRSALKDIYKTAPTKIVQSDFSITEGEDLSINQPYLTYNYSTDEITINVISYSNDIVIGTTPVMKWEDGTPVILINDWYGVGEKKAKCKIDPSYHQTEKLQGSVNFYRSNTVEPVKVITKFNLNNSGVDQPYVSFNSITGKLILNFNVFAGTPHVNKVPKLTWLGDTTSDREIVTLTTDWVGLGTYSAYCIVDLTGHYLNENTSTGLDSTGLDSTGLYTSGLLDTLEGVIELSYEPGSSEAWSLRYNWNRYDILASTIQTALDQSIPINIADYQIYAVTVNKAISDIIFLESSLEKDYAVTSGTDLTTINHLLNTLNKWKINLKDALANLNYIFSTIKS